MQLTFTRFGREVRLEERSLPPATVKYLIDYGWKQSLSDSFAAAKDADEFEGKLLARYDKLVAGTMSEPRAGGTRTTDPVEREFKRLLASKVSEWHGERKAAKKPKASDELTAIWLERFLSLHSAELREMAERNVDAAKSIDATGLDDLLEGLE